MRYSLNFVLNFLRIFLLAIPYFCAYLYPTNIRPSWASEQWLSLSNSKSIEQPATNNRMGFNSKARHHMPGILMQWREYINQVATIADVEPIPDVVEKIFKYCLVIIMLKGLTQAGKKY